MNKQQIEKSIKEIKRRYRIGRDILEQCGPRSSSGQIHEFAEKHSISRDMCQKLRVMASPETGYTKAELDSLFQQFRKAGHALSISHFIKLVSVPRGSKRNRLTQQAIKHQWSSHQLQAEILAVQGRRKQGGRRPKLANEKQFAVQLMQQIWSWRRWLALHGETIEKLDPGLRKAAQALRQKMAAVAEVLGEGR